MAYTDKNYPSAKAVKEDFAKGVRIHCHQPGGLFPLPCPGTVCLEGPHYPAPHKWYLDVQVDERGYIIKINK